MTQAQSQVADEPETTVATCGDQLFEETRFPVRCVTAAALFDGHDASINVIRRILQDAGAEVIHLGHDRSVDEIVRAAIQEDAQAIAISSYQGGHMEFLQYTKDLLAERGASHITLWAGGGGTIVPKEVQALHAYGVNRVFTPEDGRRLGLHGMIREIIKGSDFDTLAVAPPVLTDLLESTDPEVRNGAAARFMTLAERPTALEGGAELLEAVRARAKTKDVPILGLTGPGGAGKSSFVDELILRLLRDDATRRIAVISVDPTKRRTGGALLGDRIRMNTAHHPQVFMRSIATRGTGTELAASVGDAMEIAKAAGFDLILLESSGIGQAGSAVTDVADVSVYVMTPEYGAASQLEKIDMLDLADVVVLNKFDRRGAEDALRDVRKQYRRGRGMLPHLADHELPVFGTVSANFNDDGVTASYLRILVELSRVTGKELVSHASVGEGVTSSTRRAPVIPAHRQGYLAEVAQSVRAWRRWVEEQVELAREWDALERAQRRFASEAPVAASLARGLAEVQAALDPTARQLLDSWSALKTTYEGDEFVYKIRDAELREPLVSKSLSGTRIPRVAIPRGDSRAEVLRYMLLENVPGSFPFTAGVFPLKRRGEEPKRMFAGEGGPDRTNTRFHYLCKGEAAKRLSTAFDSVTLYGRDPGRRPDIYGKIGETGVSICTLEDMKRLYQGFDLCDPSTSVSMTINGPAPMILAMFLNTAIDQQVDAFLEAHGRVPNVDEHQQLVAKTLAVVRGTVQADILKEDQAQNTCIFSTPFALKMMGDIQEYFVEHKVRNYYSVSISGYHIAEAGANPITQLAFTLANGFTYVEYYLSRGMAIDTFAPNLSFFFSNGLDPEYTVIGRVARRIWAIAMRDVYDASERSQKLKYHIQTSGRSLHAMEVDFNDIRTTLQALLALQDNCNSLHTNAYDEAVTTPTEESVRRAMAIQLITNREFGWSKNENPLQGSLFVDRLTDDVEAAVLKEFDRISERGGVLGAMETQYQRGRIQDESLLYERLKHSGELPVVGVNCFLSESGDNESVLDSMPLSRSSTDEKDRRISELVAFQERGKGEADAALAALQKVALSGGNVFAELMRTVRVASLGRITDALFDVGGRYRRNL